jgi:hypothetical protein
MAIQVEYLNSNTAIAFPFCEDATGLKRSVDDLFAMPLDVFVDAAFEVPHDFASTNRLYLMGCSYVDADTLLASIGDGTSSVVDVTIVASGVFTVATAVDHGVTARLVVDSVALRTYLAAMESPIAYGTSLPFEPSTQDVINPQVLSFSLYNNGPLQPPEEGTLSGDVRILSGYNVGVNIDVIEDDTVPIDINALPGLGLGTLPCTEADPPFTNVPPGMVPNKGNIGFVPGDEGCYAVVVNPTSNLIQIQGRCQACCTCEDMTDMLGVLNGIGARILEVQTTLNAGRAIYEDGVTRFNQSIAPDYTTVTMTVNGMRGSDWGTGATNRGSPNWARVVMSINNRRPNPAEITSWKMTFYNPAAVTYEDISWSYSGTGGKTSMGGVLPVLAGNRCLVVTLLVSVTLQQWQQNPRWSALVEVEATDKVTAAKDVMTQTLEFS